MVSKMPAMTETIRTLLVFSLLSLCVTACSPGVRSGDDDDSASDDDDAVGFTGGVELETSLGTLEVQLFLEDSPITAANFLAYVDEGFYDGDDGLGATVFHRVIPGFMAQGGGQTAEGLSKDTHSAILNEASQSGLSNLRGTLAMARTNSPNSATSQFFVNVVDNVFLDPGGSTPDGYAVFGEVISGMDVVDEIVEVATDANDNPLEAVVILEAARIE